MLKMKARCSYPGFTHWLKRKFYLSDPHGSVLQLVFANQNCRWRVIFFTSEKKNCNSFSKCDICCLFFQDPVTGEGKLQTNQRPEESSQNHQQAFSLHLGKTTGCVKILPPSTEDISFHKLRESQNEHEDIKSVSAKAIECTSTPPAPDGETTHVDEPGLTKPVTGPVILPFPAELSLSDSCPGEAKQTDSILHPLLTRQRAEV